MAEAGLTMIDDVPDDLTKDQLMGVLEELVRQLRHMGAAKV